MEGETWPGYPGRDGALLGSLLWQFERSQWLPPDTLLQLQMSQVQRLLAHARATAPFWRQRLSAFERLARQPLTPEQWQALPLLTRREVQAAGDSLDSELVPAAFGAITRAETSGSTGEPVQVRQTALDRLMWSAMTLREHHWHRRDFSGRLASIRVFGNARAAGPHGMEVADWGAPAGHLYRTGPMAMLELSTDVADQAAWLQRQDPDYLLTYPTNLAALLEHAERHGWRLPRLREVRTVGETLDADLRRRCADDWDVAVTDCYSSRELGYLALQCPVSGCYHVSAETVLLEVLDEDGRAVAPGGIGQVVVTPLHNYATPLVRYALNDYAEVGQPCACGRGLPVLRRILGRSRNMLVLPDGRRYWPQVGFGRFRSIAPVRQYQLEQHSVSRIRVRLVVDRPLRDTEEKALGEVIIAALGHPFELVFDYVDGEIGRGPGGKYEEFVSRVALPG